MTCTPQNETSNKSAANFVAALLDENRIMDMQATLAHCKDNPDSCKEYYAEWGITPTKFRQSIEKALKISMVDASVIERALVWLNSESGLDSFNCPKEMSLESIVGKAIESGGGGQIVFSQGDITWSAHEVRPPHETVNVAGFVPDSVRVSVIEILAAHNRVHLHTPPKQREYGEARTEEILRTPNAARLNAALEKFGLALRIQRVDLKSKLWRAMSGDEVIGSPANFYEARRELADAAG